MIKCQLPGHTLGSAFICCRLIFFACAVNRKLGEDLLNQGALDAIAQVFSFSLNVAFGKSPK
jgi:hypothetical protein